MLSMQKIVGKLASFGKWTLFNKSSLDFDFYLGFIFANQPHPIQTTYSSTQLVMRATQFQSWIAVLALVVAAAGAANDPCGTPPPGFEIFEPGYDLSDIDLLNLNNMNWKRPAIAVSCQPGNTYVNDYNKKT